MSDLTPQAKALFAEYLDRNACGESLEFEVWVQAYPEFDEQLRTLHARDQDIRLHLESDLPELGGLGPLLPGAHSVESFFRHGKRRTPSEPSSASRVHRPGDQLGDFRLIAVIGRGGMGEVWEAEELDLGRRVALKLVLPGRLDERSLELFAREARAGGRLSHAGIVRIHGYGQSDGVHWINQELVEGGWTLRDFIDEMRSSPKLPEDYYARVAEFTIQLADALQAAHDAGVIHRDIKPPNILIGPDDCPKISDFGLARISGDLMHSVTGDFAGTWLYMSPEQVTAKRIEIDHRTDIFSLGIVLYEMLSLQRPFDGDTTHQIAEKIIYWEPPNLRKIRSRVPADLSIICAKALEKRKDARFDSMSELAADLRRHLAHEPIHAQPPNPLQRVQKWIRRHPTKSAATAVTIAAVAVIAGLLAHNVKTNRQLEQSFTELATANTGLESANTSLATANEKLATEKDATASALESARQERDRAREEEVRADRARESAEKQTYSALLHAANVAFISGDLTEAHRLHTLCPESQRGWEWRYLSLVMDQSEVEMFGQNLVATAVDWSPDGTKLAVFFSDESLRILDAISFEVIRELAAENAEHSEEIPKGRAHLVSWSPSGKQLLVGSYNDRNLRVWDTETWQISSVLQGWEGKVSSASWSPSGKGIAIGISMRDSYDSEGAYRGIGSNGLQVVDTISWRVVQSAMHLWGVPTRLAWSLDGKIDVSGNSPISLATWDPQKGGTPASQEAGIAGRILDASWSRDGKSVALSYVDAGSTSSDWVGDLGRAKDSYGLTIRDLVGGEAPVFMEDPGGRARLLSWSPDGARIAAGVDGRLAIWDVGNGRLTALQTGSKRGFDSLAWSPSGLRIATTSAGGRLQIWDTSRETTLSTSIPFQAMSPDNVAWSPEGTRFAVVQDDAWDGSTVVKVYDATSGAEEMTIAGGTERFFSVSWSLDGERLLTFSDIYLQSGERRPRLFQGTVFRTYKATGSLMRVWDRKTGKCIQTIDGYSWPLWRGILSPDGDRVLCTPLGADGLYILDISSGLVSRVYAEYKGHIEFVQWSPNGAIIFAGIGEEVVAWNIREDRVMWSTKVGSIESQHPTWRRAGCSPDGQYIAIQIETGPLLLLSSRSGDVKQAYSLASNQYVMSWSPDGSRIATGDWWGHIQIWGVDFKEHLLSIDSKFYVYDLAWSPDGSRLLLASEEGLRVLETQKNSRLRIRRAHEKRDRLVPIVEELFGDLGLSDAVQDALWARTDLSSEDRLTAVSMAKAWGDASAEQLWKLAADSFCPESTEAGGLSPARGPALVKRAHQLLPAWSPKEFDFLSKALFASGEYREALVASQDALTAASKKQMDPDSLAEYRASVEDMRTKIDGVKSESPPTLFQEPND